MSYTDFRTAMAAMSAAAPSSQSMPQPMELTDPLIIDDEALGHRCEAAVIWLHGLGDKPMDWESAMRQIRRDAPGRWKFIIPKGPRIPQPWKNGDVKNAWGQFHTCDCMHVGSRDYDDPDPNGYYYSAAFGVHNLAQELILREGIPANKILLGGFSQGGAVALQTLVLFPRSFGACVSLSGWLTPVTRQLLAQGGVSGLPPILLCHGTHDETIGLDCAHAAHRTLRGLNFDVKLETYTGQGHATSMVEMKTAGDFIIEKLSGRTIEEAQRLKANTKLSAAQKAAQEVALSMASRMMNEVSQVGRAEPTSHRWAEVAEVPLPLMPYSDDDDKKPLLYKRGATWGSAGTAGSASRGSPELAAFFNSKRQKSDGGSAKPESKVSFY